MVAVGFQRQPARPERARGWLRPLMVGVATALIVVGGSACRRRETGPSDARKPAPLPSRPREVVADVVIPSPAAFWQAAQALGGGPLALLPRGPELALGAALGLPPLVATRFDLRSPAAGVVVLSPEPAPVLAIRVTSGPELVADLTTGAAARYRVERDGEVSVLAPVAPSGPALSLAPVTALAVLDDALLVGPRAWFARVSPYLVRSLLARADNAGPVSLTLPGHALREIVVPALEARWQKQLAELVANQDQERVSRGRPADLADPKAVLEALDGAVESALAILSSLSQARAELVLSEARLELELRLAPEAAGVARATLTSLTKRRALQAMALPAETAVLAFWTRAAAAEPSGGVNPLAALLGNRLKPEDERAVTEALGELDAGLGPAHAVGLLADLSVAWRGDVRDAKQLRQGIHDLLGLAKREPVAAPLAARLGRPALAEKSLRVPGLDDAVQRVDVTFVPRVPAGGPSSPPLRLTIDSAVGAERALAGLSRRGELPLPLLVAAEKGERSLGAEPASKELLSSAGEVKWLLFADLAKLGLAAEASPCSLALVGENEAMALELVATKGAVRAALALGLRP